MTRFIYPLILCCFIWLSRSASAQSDPVSNYFPDIKIFESNDPAPGYFFLASKGLSAPGAKFYIAIVDNYGTPVFFRLMPKPSLSMRLLKDGTIGYVHGVPRKLYLMDTMLNVTDTINTVGNKMDGHDWDIDDGRDYHRYVFAQYQRTVDMSQLVTGGNPSAEIEETVIQEFDPDNNLLNAWRTEDLFQILDGNDESPFLDFTEASIDYAHLNGIAVYSDTSFVVSTRHMEEITNIDRRNGEIIWRLGGKNNDFTFIDDPEGFSHQHCPRRLDNGNLLLFDNGNLHDPRYSSAVEYELDEANLTARLVNRYRRTPDGFAPRDGAVQRLKNGNTIISWGPVGPTLTEFHADGSLAIELDISEHSLSPRNEKFLWKTKVFETSLDSIEFGMYDGVDPVEVTIQLLNNTDSVMHITGFTGRTGHFYVATSLPLAMPPGVPTEIMLTFDPQNTTVGYLKDVLTLCSDNESQRIARQLFLEGNQQDNISPTLIMMPDSSNVPADAVVTMDFSEPVRRSDGSVIDHTNVNDLIIWRETDQNGDHVPYTASINSEKTLITVRPTSVLNNGRNYYVDLADQLEDYSGNILSYTAGTFRTATPVSVNWSLTNENFMVFPNPSTGIFTMTSDYSQKAHMKVYSSRGSLVLQHPLFNLTRMNIDLSGHPSGVYYGIIRSEDNLVIGTVKLLVK